MVVNDVNTIHNGPTEGVQQYYSDVLLVLQKDQQVSVGYLPLHMKYICSYLNVITGDHEYIVISLNACVVLTTAATEHVGIMIILFLSVVMNKE